MNFVKDLFCSPQYLEAYFQVSCKEGLKSMGKEL